MLLPISLTLAAACALINFWLAVRCSRQRMTANVLHGDGGDGIMIKRMRAHSNFIEYTPIILILFALVELAIGASLWLWLAAFAYVLARIAHPIGMDRDTSSPLRAGGIAVTMLVMLGLTITALFTAYQASREIPAPPSLAANR